MIPERKCIAAVCRFGYNSIAWGCQSIQKPHPPRTKYGGRCYTGCSWWKTMFHNCPLWPLRRRYGAANVKQKLKCMVNLIKAEMRQRKVWGPKIWLDALVFVPADEVGWGQKDGERLSGVSDHYLEKYSFNLLQTWGSLQKWFDCGVCQSNFSWWSKSGRYLWFLIRQKNLYSIHLKIIPFWAVALW